MICEIEIPNTPGAGSRRAAGTGERKMNKSKRSLKDFVWKGDCFGKKWLYLQKTSSYWKICQQYVNFSE